jgi:hypothetical protein
MPTLLPEEPKDYRPGWIDIIGVFVAPVIVVVAVVAVLLLDPRAARHIASAAEAEFGTVQVLAPLQSQSPPSVIAAVKAK